VVDILAFDTGRHANSTGESEQLFKLDHYLKIYFLMHDFCKSDTFLNGRKITLNPSGKRLKSNDNGKVAQLPTTSSSDLNAFC
jgi:hypothetical protein